MPPAAMKAPKNHQAQPGIVLELSKKRDACVYCQAKFVNDYHVCKVAQAVVVRAGHRRGNKKLTAEDIKAIQAAWSAAKEKGDV